LSLYGDLNGQMGALDLGEKRMNALLDEYGDGKVPNALVELTDRARRADAGGDFRPAGRARSQAEDFLDNDGIVDQPLKIASTWTSTATGW
jgi:N-methylhydantoinase B